MEDNELHTDSGAVSDDAQGKAGPGRVSNPGVSSPAVLVLAWLAVGLPLLWGVAQTIRKTFALFS